MHVLFIVRYTLFVVFPPQLLLKRIAMASTLVHRTFFLEHKSFERRTVAWVSPVFLSLAVSLEAPAALEGLALSTHGTHDPSGDVRLSGSISKLQASLSSFIFHGLTWLFWGV